MQRIPSPAGAEEGMQCLLVLPPLVDVVLVRVIADGAHDGPREDTRGGDGRERVNHGRHPP